jgi:hypothetical protein
VLGGEWAEGDGVLHKGTVVGLCERDELLFYRNLSVDWRVLQRILDDPVLTAAGCAEDALAAVAAATGHITGLPRVKGEFGDGRRKDFCSVVAFNDSRGQKTDLYMNFRRQQLEQCYDEVSVLNPIFSIFDGGTGRTDPQNNVVEAKRGHISAPTAPNCSHFDQHHDSKHQFGKVKVAQVSVVEGFVFQQASLPSLQFAMAHSKVIRVTTSYVDVVGERP